ncbi:MAG: polysaccharide deacetylase family protein [Candidatus Omnitrophota bacterium]|nr:polysaccharide deacetylase family protein [Candidatus Omnitrophota bacterium]
MNAGKSYLIQIDMDNFDVLANYYGLPAANDAENRIYDIAAPRILELLKKRNIKATFFVSGKDFAAKGGAYVWIKRILDGGHEIANHSLNHALGFSGLSAETIEREVMANHDMIKEYFGVECRGFRAPGYDVNSALLKILSKNGYLYDTSYFPSSVIFLYKFCHFLLTLRAGNKPPHAMGSAFSFMTPNQPYFVDGLPLLEIPVSTTKFFRLPFYFSFHLCIDDKVIEWLFRRLSLKSVNYLLHACDFLDCQRDNLRGNFASIANIKRPLSEKIDKFNMIMDCLSVNGYENMLSRDLAGLFLRERPGR